MIGPFREVIAALAADYDGALLNLLRLVHLWGLLLSGGSVLVLDIYVMRSPELDAKLFSFASWLVVAGLTLLWLSGLGFLFYYCHFAPEKLPNGKLAAKIIIVAILTANGILIHKNVLPRVHALESFGVGLLAIGVVSAVSWLTAVVLGVFGQLNSLSAATVLQAYFAVLLIALIAVLGGAHWRRQWYGVPVDRTVLSARRAATLGDNQDV